jgi:hypothetical protein
MVFISNDRLRHPDPVVKGLFLREHASTEACGSVPLVWTASVVLWLACWPLVPEFAGSNPAEAVGFSVFRKIHSTPSYGGEVK